MVLSLRQTCQSTNKTSVVIILQNIMFDKVTGPTVCSRGCSGLHRRPISTHNYNTYKMDILCVLYITFFWTPSSSRLEQTLVTATEIECCVHVYIYNTFYILPYLQSSAGQRAARELLNTSHSVEYSLRSRTTGSLRN